MLTTPHPPANAPLPTPTSGQTVIVKFDDLGDYLRRHGLRITHCYWRRDEKRPTLEVIPVSAEIPAASDDSPAARQ